jgi:hypothetical protein
MRIEAIGTNPWLARWISGTVRLKIPRSRTLTVTALDGNGYPRKDLGTADSISLLPDCLYYHIHN